MKAGGRLDVGLVRQPRGPVRVGSEPELVERIRHEIEAEGPIPFARFMERSLYEPGLGYYRRGRPGPGVEGDFLTAPETHPVFGRIVARQLAEIWERLGHPTPFILREHGAGEGSLAVSILDGLATDAPEALRAIRVEPVEVEQARLDAFARRLEAAGHGGRQRAATDGAIVGVVLANEVLDALPFHRVEWRDGRLRELLVTWRDGHFAEVATDPTTPALAARLDSEGVRLVEGQRAEICLALDDWMARASETLDRGALLLVDYGHPAEELYGPRRRAGTLMAYVGHRAHDDPFVNVGRQDLTAHVDVTAVERAATAARLDHLGTTTQAEFLMGLGVESVLRETQVDPTTTAESYLSLRAALSRLLDPSATGRFSVMAFGRGMPANPPLRGFAFRIPPRGASTGDLYG